MNSCISREITWCITMQISTLWGCFILEIVKEIEKWIHDVFGEQEQKERVFLTSWLSSMAHSLADWALASTMTLNMVHIDWGTRKSVVRGLFCNFNSKAALVLTKRNICLFVPGTWDLTHQTRPFNKWSNTKQLLHRFYEKKLM